MTTLLEKSEEDKKMMEFGQGEFNDELAKYYKEREEELTTVG